MTEPEKLIDTSSVAPSKSLSLQKIMHANAGQLLTYLHSKIPPELRSIIEPQDVLQDTFFEAFQRIAEFSPNGENAAYGWLLTIARNRLLAIIRRHRRPKWGGTARAEQMAVSVILEEFAVYSRTPSQSAMSHELAATLQRSIGKIEPHFREVIQLRYLDGLSAKQSAERMGRTEDAIFKLCARALHALKLQLQSGAVAG